MARRSRPTARSLDDDGPLIGENMVFEIHPTSRARLGHVCAGDVAVATARGGGG